MIVVPPLAINALNLTSTTVAALLAPAAFSLGTTYALGDIRKDSLNVVYQSLTSANLGNTPSVSPLYWQAIGFNEVAWTTGTYAIGDYAVTGNRVYKSIANSNTNNPPLTSPTWWIDVGPTNQYAMFDLLRNTATVAPGPITIFLTPGARIDTLGFVGVVADTVRVQITFSGVNVYDMTQTLSTYTYMGNWYDYFYATFYQKNSALFATLPLSSLMVIQITFARASGNVSVGSVVMGTAYDMGGIQYNPKNSATNYSRITRDDFGTATLNPRRSVPKSTQVSWLAKEKVQGLLNLRDNVLNGAPALYCGLTAIDHSYFDPLLILGVYKQIDVDMSYENIAPVTSEIEEL